MLMKNVGSIIARGENVEDEEAIDVTSPWRVQRRAPVFCCVAARDARAMIEPLL